MSRFASTQDAKEFLVGQLVLQAQRDEISLTEVERKMLYFSETDWKQANKDSSWSDALRLLRKGDHYIVVMLDGAGI